MQILERNRFREALIARMALVGIGAADLSRRTGVSKAQIDKLRQRKTETTNVYDAVLIARFFGQTVEEFMGIAPRQAKMDEIIETLSSLPPGIKDMFLLQIKAVSAARRRD